MSCIKEQAWLDRRFKSTAIPAKTISTTWKPTMPNPSRFGTSAEALAETKETWRTVAQSEFKSRKPGVDNVVFTIYKNCIQNSPCMPLLPNAIIKKIVHISSSSAKELVSLWIFVMHTDGALYCSHYRTTAFNYIPLRSPWCGSLLDWNGLNKESTAVMVCMHIQLYTVIWTKHSSV